MRAAVGRRARRPGARRGRARASAGRAGARAAGARARAPRARRRPRRGARRRGRRRRARPGRQPQVVEPRDLRLRRSARRATSASAGPRHSASACAQRRRRLPRLAARELVASAPEAAPRSGRRRARPAAAAARSRRPPRPRPRRPRPRAAATPRHGPRFSRCCGPAPSHSSSTTRSRWTIAPRCTSRSARSESARPRGMRRARRPDVDLDRPEDPELAHLIRRAWRPTDR